ncbi:MAG: Rap1a/Tai family immunity protein [Alphaproteobacteria bacterium]
MRLPISLARNRYFTILLVGILSCAHTAPAHALLDKGGELLEACVDAGYNGGSLAPIRGFKEGLCVGYISGLVAIGASLGKGAPPEMAQALGKISLCVPANFKLDSAINLVVDYLKRNRSSLSQHPSELVFKAIQTRWPCDINPIEER